MENRIKNLTVIEKIDYLIAQLELMKMAVERQGVLNAGFVDSYRMMLIEISAKIKANEKMDNVQKEKWKNHIGRVDRLFEGTPYVDMFYEINNSTYFE